MNAKHVWLAALLSATLSIGARADVIVWEENFSDVSDWNVIFNAQGDSSSITSDGSLGRLFVQVVQNEVAYGPTSTFAFDPVNAGDFAMSFTVDSITASVSYDIRLDMFNASSVYVGSVFNVVPQGTFAGTDTVNLGGFTYDPATAFLSPKITVFTGPSVSDQSVFFDNLAFSVVPEPSTTCLLLAGAAALGLIRSRSRCSARVR